MAGFLHNWGYSLLADQISSTKRVENISFLKTLHSPQKSLSIDESGILRIAAKCRISDNDLDLWRDHLVPIFHDLIDCKIDGLAPLQIAVQNGCSDEILALLLDSIDPAESLQIVDEDTGNTLLHDCLLKGLKMSKFGGLEMSTKALLLLSSSFPITLLTPNKVL